MSAQPCPLIGTEHDCILCEPKVAWQQAADFFTLSLARGMARDLAARGSAVLRLGTFVHWWTS